LFNGLDIVLILDWLDWLDWLVWLLLGFFTIF
jgi:hypothetical protein